MMPNVSGGGYSWMWMIPMVFVMVAFFGLVVWGVVHVMHRDRQLGSGGPYHLCGSRQAQVAPPSGESAEEILARRFAEGKIDYEEFQHRLDMIMQYNDLWGKAGTF
ncbi:MAG: SHOCT domain-containing protein [Acidimicrobiales bacterium]